ncbi:Hypothetical predicted protein [Pelobates cultripes]|uniref:Uncharacterized protein n=1 Tax=Pelobates cultripes TaxID=61616 RepID=A0AAD1VU49_PELCU|nr:Hypothetical predicted protein [Pelobates cultripes]
MDLDKHKTETASNNVIRNKITSSAFFNDNQKGFEEMKPKQHESTSRSSVRKPTSKTKMPKSPCKSAGRETKYASLQSIARTNKGSSSTKPGVIRPITLRVTLMEQYDEMGHSHPYNQGSVTSGRNTSNSVSNKRDII